MWMGVRINKSLHFRLHGGVSSHCVFIQHWLFLQACMPIHWMH